MADLSAPLPLRERNTSGSSSRTPIWTLSNAAAPANDIPCDRHSGDRDGVCCKELKGDERHLVDPDIVRDVVIGLSDGLTVPFALTAGLSSLGESRLVVLGGVAELVAGRNLHGCWWLLRNVTTTATYTSKPLRVCYAQCSGEMEREVHEVLGPIGVDERLSRQVAHDLMNLEVEGTTSNSGVNTNSAAAGGDVESSGPRQDKDVGITTFLLKFGEGIEEVPTRRLYISAFTIGMSYLIGGIIPLMPYFFIPRAHVALMWSILVTGVTLIVTLFVGGAAAAAAYGIIVAIEKK
ncbi:VIT family-domain-containing protein [Phellopilus nigrolimitatus]|nr:VIT family-domain-containing protein [Phellopilus nigrolimitatus]